MTNLKALPDGKREGAAILAALDNAPLTRSHWLFLAALFGALVFDYMKPYTLSFVIPGTRAMFGLSEGEAAYLPVAGLTGTALGAAFWGVVADRIGRRTTLLWTVAIFTLGSLCGLSTSYWQMLAACLVMGFGVGGETPIVFSLAAEYVPARSRTRSLLLLGILGATGGYLLAALVAAGANALFAPMAAWRAMWLAGLAPAALILLLRSRVIPESARYLLVKGRVGEARRAAESLVGPLPADGSAGEDRTRFPAERTGVSYAPLYGRTAVLAFFSFAWGLANFGFVTWLPSIFAELGYSEARTSVYLALSALAALPGLAVTMALLSRWSVRTTLVAYAVAGAVTLVALGAGLDELPAAALVGVVTAGLIFISSIGGVFSFYAAEVFPTAIRSQRSGLVASVGRVGAVVGPYFGGVWLARGGGPLGLQVPLAVALLVGGVMLFAFGVETRGRRLEDIDHAVADGGAKTPHGPCVAAALGRVPARGPARHAERWDWVRARAPPRPHPFSH